MLTGGLRISQDQLASLYGVERPGITQHIKNIFTEGELEEKSVSKKFLRTARRYGEQSEKESDKNKDLGEELADV
jgi:hypothetical protein